MSKIHLSDCAVHNGPAYEPGPCDCGASNLTVDMPHGFISALVAGSGRGRGIICECPACSLIEAQDFPSDRLIVDAPAANLPDTHNIVVRSADADSVDLNDAEKAVILDVKPDALL